MHLIKVGMARQYVQNLGEEVKKGLRQKAKEGFVPGKAPYGYVKINKNESAINEETSPFVLKAFNLYSQGNLSLEKTASKLYELGYIYKPAQPKIYRSQLENMLKNDFYYGKVRLRNELYQGKHKPLISKELFDMVQMAFRKDNKPKHYETNNFLLGGILRCANCGCVVSGEIKKGKYVYYSCTGAKTPCEQKHKYVKEETLEKQVIRALSKIKLDEKQKQWIQLILTDSFKDEQQYTKTRLNSLNTQKQMLRNRIEQLYVDKLDGKIAEEFWLKKHEEWSLSLFKTQNMIQAYEKTKIDFILPQKIAIRKKKRPIP